MIGGSLESYVGFTKRVETYQRIGVPSKCCMDSPRNGPEIGVPLRVSFGVHQIGYASFTRVPLKVILNTNRAPEASSPY